ncbi:hypothetical protein BpHYR1_006387 [Brachionus plicatilis]|uniref:Uncharacterized protein n=1 Tax=Brachionus plicatilis TaxID=10195 RepID=A0A3M7R6C4_BRAPC|nr:hypothetical protein BpHYR1_006387 [Brachionus plicatilis]
MLTGYFRNCNKSRLFKIEAVPSGYSPLFSPLSLKYGVVRCLLVCRHLIFHRLVDCVYTRFKWEKFYNPDIVLENLKKLKLKNFHDGPNHVLIQSIIFYT